MKKDISDAIDNILKSSQGKFESLEQFTEQVLIDYILYMSKKSVIIDYTKIKDTKEELLLEIAEITRKKMYGFYDINEYRDFLTKRNA